jgi:hypothetical protein
MLTFGLLVAVAVFLHAVLSAPEGVEKEAGFVLEPRLQRQLLAEDTGLLKSSRGPMSRISAITIGRS